MKFLRFASFLFVALLALLAEKDACGQWNNVAPNIITPIYHDGSISYSNGKIVASMGGNYNIAISDDNGLTWQLVKSPGINVWDLDIFEGNTVLATTYEAGLFISIDGGYTWKHTTMTSGANFRSGKFINSPQSIITTPGGGQLYISHDQGTTWDTILISNSLSGGYIQVQKKDTSIYLIGFGFPFSKVCSSVNQGNSWIESKGTTYFDCNSLAVDACNDSIIYVMNEASATPTDGFGHIFCSYNKGLTFNKTTNVGTKYYCGSIITAPAGTAYVQTQTSDGILRSTDHGLTWKSIDGPPGFEDSRTICCKDDNTIFAIDTKGSIWETINSGGDPIPIRSHAPSIFSIQTADQKTDTIGGSVAVPIWLKGLNDTEDVYILIHYDPALNSTGTYSPAGAKLDIVNESWIGRSKIHIATADTSRILAYSRFNVFADSSIKPKVTFDSVTTTNQSVDPCTLALIPTFTTPATATIAPASGCGIQTISQFLHEGITPQLSIIPNPTSGVISITSTHDLGEVSVAIYDILGNQRGLNMVKITRNSSGKLALPEVNGVYNVRVRSAEKSWDLRIVVSR